MDASRKAAYRAIIYHFLLAVRTFPLPLVDDEVAIRIGCYAGPVAYQLHNLALASVQDFADFDEAGFWTGLTIFDQHNSAMPVARSYRQIFEQVLAGG